MLSFKVVTNEQLDAFSDESAKEILESVLSAFDDECEIAAAISHGCLLIRVFDYGRYYFLYPFELTGDALVRKAIDELIRYAVREELPLVISDVPAEALGELLVGFTHLDVDATSPECESYLVKVKTECQMIDALPAYEGELVSLTELYDSDEAPLAALSRDEQINRYWGYDYREDFSDVDASHFLSEARAEFMRGAAMTFAVRHNGDFVGDAVLYAFDGRGNAHLGVRILVEHQRRGYARAAIEGLFDIASRLGLGKIYAECHKDNAASENMLRSIFDFIGKDEEKLLFSKELY